MRPVLFSLGQFHLYSFGVMVALGVIVALSLMLRRARGREFPQVNDVYDMVFITVTMGFVGARAFYVIQNLSWYLEHPLKIFALWEGGLIFYGGLAAAVFSLYLFALRRKVPFWAVLDFLFPYVALAHAFGRLGCFLNGCCYGHACSLPWAVQFPNLPVPVHPTQLYEAAYNVFVFLLLSAYDPKRKFEGSVSACYLMLYAVGRFTIEFWRADNPMWMLLTWNQWMSLGLLSAGAVLFYWKRGRSAESRKERA